MSEALRMEDVHKSFGKLEVLRGIDLALEEHEVVWLIGACGWGKSTLQRGCDVGSGMRTATTSRATGCVGSPPT